MTPQEYGAWIRQHAARIGLDPALAESVWRQESGGSVDTALKGQALSRSRGHAIGPWQVVPAYHPNFPVEGDPIAQGQYAMQYLKEVGPARYYGTGQAPEGHPTTAQYVAQVMRRAGRPDVRQAASVQGSTDTDRTPTGDPRTGAMDRSPTMLPPFQLPQAQPQPQEQSPLLPLIALIAGTAMSKGGGLGRLMSGAGLAGTALRNADVAENELLDLQAKRAEAAQRRQSKDAITRYAEMLQQDPKTADIGAMMMVNPAAGLDYYAKQRLEQQQMAQRQPLVEQLRDMGDERGAVMAGLGYSPGAGPDTGGRQYGLTPQMYQTPEGKTMERVYAQDGSFVDREIPGTPTRYDPNVAGAVAQGQAAGKVKGTSAAETEIALPKVLADFDLTIGVVDAMLNHAGREWATGWQGNVPAIGGTEQANYISKMEQLEGANFKEAFESLKGGGQITQVEGEKATRALTDLNRLQSDEEHRKSLATLRKILMDNRARALAKAGRPVPQEPVQVAPVEPPTPASGGGWSIRKKE